MSPFRKLASQTVIYGLPTMVGRLLSYLLTPLYTYIFSPSEYGVVTALYAYVAFLLVLLTYGMETALFSFSRSEPDKNKVYTTALLSVFGTSLAFILLAGWFAAPIAGAIQIPAHPEYVVWFALIIGADALAAIPMAKLREMNKAGRFAFIRTLNIALNILLNVFFVWVLGNAHSNPGSAFYSLAQSVYDPEIGVGYIFISNLISSGIMLVLLLPDMFRFRPDFDSALWKRMIFYAIPLLIAGMAGMVNETVDRILLTYLLPEDQALSQTGIYGACYKISIIMTLFIQTFRFAAEPFFFSRSGESDSREVTAAIMKYFVMICCAIFLGTMMNLSWIQYFVGEEYRQGLHVVPVLLMANLFLGIYINQSIWYKLSGQTHFGAWIAIGGALITLVLNWIWIPAFGYTGSAWATLICYFSMTAVSYLIGQKHYPVPYDLIRILGFLLLAFGLFWVSGRIQTGPGMAGIFIHNIFLLFFIGAVFLAERSSLRKFLRR